MRFSGINCVGYFFIYLTFLLSAVITGCGSRQQRVLPDPVMPAGADQYGVSDSIASGTLYQLHFIDVGRGDAILVLTPAKTLLVDGGDRNAGVTGYLRQHGVEIIDIVIATHPHADHIGGLPEVFENFPVGEVIDPGVVHSTLTYERYLTLIDELDITYTEGRKGMSRELGGGAYLEILHPASLSTDTIDMTGDYDDIDDHTSAGHKLNNSSVVVILILGNITALLTGDIEREAEQMLVAAGTDLRSHILKVAHHGSTTSSTMEFLEKVRPETAVIMCGVYNSYGYPHSQTLHNLGEVGTDIYRTDTGGHIIISSDGITYTVEVTDSRQIRMIDINTASFGELQNIIHIGPERAGQIIRLRPFDSVDDLIRVDGIGPVRLEAIKLQNIAVVENEH